MYIMVCYVAAQGIGPLETSSGSPPARQGGRRELSIV